MQYIRHNYGTYIYHVQCVYIHVRQLSLTLYFLLRMPIVMVGMLKVENLIVCIGWMLLLPGTEFLVEDLNKTSGVGKGIHRKSMIMKEECQ